jgi:quercetin dioxygenase-like cupin family protein
MNDSKLIEYLQGVISPADDKELEKLLKSNGIDKRIAEISNQFENIALTAPSIKPSKELKSSIFSYLENKGSKKFSGQINRLVAFFQLPVSRIKEILDTTSDTSLDLWDKARIEGAYLHHFKAGGTLSEAHCGLIYLEAGAEITEHEHLGEEKMLVLQGEVTTSDGLTYQVGEIAISEKGSSHTLIAGTDSVCIFAVIANGGVDFKDV